MSLCVHKVCTYVKYDNNSINACSHFSNLLNLRNIDGFRLLTMEYMCVTLISFIHVTTKDSSTCTTMLVLACEPATSANTSIDGRGSTTSPYNMDGYNDIIRSSVGAMHAIVCMCI